MKKNLNLTKIPNLIYPYDLKSNIKIFVKNMIKL